jgi:hypothetical protein
MHADEYQSLLNKKAEIEEKIRLYEKLSVVSGNMDVAIQRCQNLTIPENMNLEVLKIDVEFQGKEKSYGVTLDLRNCCLTVYSVAEMIINAIQSQRDMIHEERKAIKLPRFE